MASSRPQVVASGADVGDGVRRRPVAAGQSVPLDAAPQAEDKKKKLAKKVRSRMR
jgi:dolichyl-phosphate-mannose-protein mannosyltransferase